MATPDHTPRGRGYQVRQMRGQHMRDQHMRGQHMRDLRAMRGLRQWAVYALHVSTAHCTAHALHCTALHCTALHCTALHCECIAHALHTHCTRTYCCALLRAMRYPFTLQVAMSYFHHCNDYWSMVDGMNCEAGTAARPRKVGRP